MMPRISIERKKLLNTIERLLEGPMIFLGFVWLALLIIELTSGISPLLEKLSLAIWIVFILDFVLKFFLAPKKARFFKVNWLTAISLLIPAVRIFRVLRIFRALRGLRLVRVVSSLNRTMKSLGATMSRRGFGYVVILAILVVFGGAAGMLAIEKGNPGFENFGSALWWSAMRVITAGSEFWPLSTEGRVLAFLLAIFGYAIFGYVTATIATFFIGRDAEEKNTPVAGSGQINELKSEIQLLRNTIEKLNSTSKNNKT